MSETRETWLCIQDAGRYLTDVSDEELATLLEAIAQELRYRAERLEP